MRRHISLFSLGCAVIGGLGAITAGCSHSDSGAPATPPSAASSATSAQSAQKIEDSKLPDQIKANMANQAQNPSGRPAGAPTVPQAK